MTNSRKNNTSTNKFWTNSSLQQWQYLTVPTTLLLYKTNPYTSVMHYVVRCLSLLLPLGPICLEMQMSKLEIHPPTALGEKKKKKKHTCLLYSPTYQGFPTRMVHLYYISCLRYIILVRNPRYNLHVFLILFFLFCFAFFSIWRTDRYVFLFLNIMQGLSNSWGCWRLLSMTMWTVNRQQNRADNH